MSKRHRYICVFFSVTKYDHHEDYNYNYIVFVMLTLKLSAE